MILHMVTWLNMYVPGYKDDCKCIFSQVNEADVGEACTQNN